MLCIESIDTPKAVGSRHAGQQDVYSQHHVCTQLGQVQKPRQHQSSKALIEQEIEI
jgi:hypothetical protein